MFMENYEKETCIDIKKIGQFIAVQRKENHLTQKQLGDELGISDKTISKWECGNGLPDISIMLPLCQLLQINVNELLSGQRLTQDTYHEKAEENMMNLMQGYEKERKGAFRQIIAAAAWILSLIVIMLLPANISGMLNMEYVSKYLDWISFLEAVLIPLAALGFSGHLTSFRSAFYLLFHRAGQPQELENAILAVSLAIKSMLAGGAFCSMLAIIYLLFRGDIIGESFSFTANLAVALLAFLYALLGTLLLIPVKSRLEKK